jgi:hypothetical protein
LNSALGLEFLTHLNGKKSGELDRTMQRTISETQFITYQIEGKKDQPSS